MVSKNFSPLIKLYILVLFGFILLLFFTPLHAQNTGVEPPQNKHTTEQHEKPITRLDTVRFEVEILRVIDGDTAEILYGDLFLRVRLAHIDAPETRGGQPFGKAAGRFLRKRIEGKKVTLKGQRKLDGFGRFLATIYDEKGININKELVNKGFAWHYKQYSDDLSYDKLEQEARKNKRGLWQEPNPVAPWVFRKN